MPPKKSKQKDIRFEEQLALFRFFLNLFGKDSINSFSSALIMPMQKVLTKIKIHSFMSGYGISVRIVKFPRIVCAFMMKIFVVMLDLLWKNVAD